MCLRMPALAKLQIAKGLFGVNKLHVIQGDHLHEGRPTSLVVYFPGDRIESINCDPDIQRLQHPSNVAQIMSQKFPQATAVVVSPSRVEGCFSCYDHFFDKVTLSGEPLGYHGTSFKASQQLASLLEFSGIVTSKDRNTLTWQAVGFSKGGVVLNQLLAEVAALQDLRSSPSFQPSSVPPSAWLLAALQGTHYVDVGRNCRGAYTTDPRVVTSLGAWNKDHSAFRIVLHGTPRQWDDPHRPWLAIEKNRMRALCEELGVRCTEKKYFQGKKPSLLMHFQAIESMEVD